MEVRPEAMLFSRRITFMVGNLNSLNPLSLPPKQIKTQTKKTTIKSKKKKMEREIQKFLSPLLFTKQREHKIERIIIKHKKNNLNPPLFFLVFLSLQFSPLSLSLSLSRNDRRMAPGELLFCDFLFAVKLGSEPIIPAFNSFCTSVKQGLLAAHRLLLGEFGR
jgi:hypothetical protein